MKTSVIGVIALFGFAVAMPRGDFRGQDKGGKGEGKDKEPPVKKLAAVKVDSRDGVIKGFVEYDGTPPTREMIADMEKADTPKECKEAPEEQTIKQTWIVDPKTKRVANVMVFLKPPKGNYFPFDKSKITFPERVEIDQPHCAFVPHVSAVFPVYFDGKKEVKTGQVLRVKNSAPFPHNANYTGDETIGTGNIKIGTGEHKDLAFPASSTQPVRFKCDLHNWMRAIVWSFDHPYVAVTNDKGEFTIKNVPAGVDLTLVAWHEGKNPDELKGFFEEPIKVKAGEKLTKKLKVKQ